MHLHIGCQNFSKDIRVGVCSSEPSIESARMMCWNPACCLSCLKDCVLIALIAKLSYKTRLLLQLNATPSNFESLLFLALVLLPEQEIGKRALIAKDYVLFLDSECTNQVSRKSESRNQELNRKPLHTLSKVKVLFGTRLMQWLKKTLSQRRKEPVKAENHSHMSQKCLRTLFSKQLCIESLRETCGSATGSCNKDFSLRNGLNVIKTSSSGAIPVVLSHSVSIVPLSPTDKHLWLARSEPILASEFHKPTISSAIANCCFATAVNASCDYSCVDDNFKSHFNSSLADFQIKDFKNTFQLSFSGSEAFDERNSKLHSYPNIMFKPCFSSGTIADRTTNLNLTRRIDHQQSVKHVNGIREGKFSTRTELTRFSNSYINDCYVRGEMINTIAEYSSIVKINDHLLGCNQLSAVDRFGLGLRVKAPVLSMSLKIPGGGYIWANNNRDSSISELTGHEGMLKSVSSSSIQTVSKGILNKKSNSTYSYTADIFENETEGSGFLCSGKSITEIGVVDTSGMYNDGSSKHDQCTCYGNLEASPKIQRDSSTMNNKLYCLRSKKDSNACPASESSVNVSQNSSFVHGYVTSGKGSSPYVWKKVQRPIGDCHANEPKATSCGQSLLSEKPRKQSSTFVPHKASQEHNKMMQMPPFQCRKKSEDHKEESKLHGGNASDDSSDNFCGQVNLPSKKVPSEYDLSLKMLPNAREKQITMKSKLRLTNTNRGVWKRKRNSSSNENSLPILEKQLESLFSENEETINVAPGNMGTQTQTQDAECSSNCQCTSDDCSDVSNASDGSHAASKTLARNQNMVQQKHFASGRRKNTAQVFSETNNQRCDVRTCRILKQRGIVGDSQQHTSSLKVTTMTISEKGSSHKRKSDRCRQLVGQKWVPIQTKREKGPIGSKSDIQDGKCKQNETLTANFPIVSDSNSCSQREKSQTTSTSNIGDISDRNSIRCTFMPTENNLGDELSFLLSATDVNMDDVLHHMMGCALRSIHLCYISQLASADYTQLIGSPISEFEKVLHAVCPVIVHKNESVICKCNTFERPLVCSYEIPDIPLQNVWRWYEEHGNYGVEVKASELRHSSKLVTSEDVFRAYFVPYLSGIQLFGSSSVAKGACAMEGQNQHNLVKDGQAVLNTLPEISVDKENTCLRSYEEILKNACSCIQGSENAELLFEYFESEQPHQRKPMFDKIRELAKEAPNSGSQKDGNPVILNSATLRDLHPASWFAVAWYPIYRIPEGQLRTAFLTYHSLGHFLQRRGSSNLTGRTDSSIIAPVVGLRSYNSQGECWFNPNKFSRCFQQEKLPLDPLNLYQERLKILENTAAFISRGIAKAGPTSDRSKHLDYEFFIGRQRSMSCQ